MTSSVTTEEALIGAILNPATTLRVMMMCEKRKVTEAYFASPEAKMVWPIVEAQWRAHRGVDAVLVLQALEQYPKAMPWLRHCLEVAPTFVMAAQVVEAFVTDHMRSLALQVGQQLRTDALTLGGQEAIAKAEAAMVAFHDAERAIYGQRDEENREAEEIVADYELLYQKRVVEKDRSFFIGRRLPWDVLNRCYTGVKAGLHIIAARPSQGKTALAVTMSAGMAANGIKQLFISLDMKRKELRKRYGALLGNVGLARLEFGGSREEIERIRHGMKVFECLGSPTREPVHNIQIATSYHIDRILGDIYRVVKCEGVQCVWIDYLQLISSSKNGTQKEVIDDVLARLKQCALELDIPIFCLCQLNRDSGKEPNRKPTLTDLGDSGKIERDASTVLILWKDPVVREAWNKNPPLALAGGDDKLAMVLEPTWLLLVKNQQGATRDFPFIFYKNTFMFRPANHEAKPILQERKGKVEEDRSPLFNQVRDDFIILETPDGTGLDDRIKHCGALGKRGL